MRHLSRCILPFALAIAPAACGDDGDNSSGTDAAAETTPETVEETSPEVVEETAEPDTAEPDAADTVEPEAEVAEHVCVPTDPPCSDEQIALLELSDDASGGPIAEESDEPGVFISHIDATAGGFNGNLGYTYARFTDEGLLPVDLSDEDALESTEWDIAARRFILRLNSGVSGPSCVLGGRTVPGTEFDALTEVPAGVILRAEQYFTEEGCEYVPETSGIGSPQTVLSSYWSYPGCVAMTDNIYVVQLASGRHLKLQVLSYYSPSAQETCDETGAAPMPSGSGNVRIKWAFLD